MHLPPMIQSFVLHFGEMGSRWGINRTVGQVYALLYVSKSPLNADQIVRSLGVSRSNVAMSLKELSTMNMVILQHIPGDRKDYYGTHDDIWDIVRQLVEERRKREIEPTLSLLRTTMMQRATCDEEMYAQSKIQDMHDLIQMLTNWYLEMQKMETHKLINLFKMGGKIYNLYQIKDRVRLLPGGKGNEQKNNQNKINKHMKGEIDNGL